MLNPSGTECDADIILKRYCRLAVHLVEPFVVGHNHASWRVRSGATSHIAGNMT